MAVRMIAKTQQTEVHEIFPPQNFLRLHLDSASRARLKAGVEQYLDIMKRYRNVPVATDQPFQKLFNGFYRVRLPRSSMYQKFFMLLEQLKTRNYTFRELLQELSKSTGRLEASFASKMLATRNPDLPVIDRWVLDNLEFRLPRYNEQDRLKKAVRVYERLAEWYRRFLTTSTGLQALRQFDELIPRCAVTPVKKIDFILWQTRNR